MVCAYIHTHMCAYNVNVMYRVFQKYCKIPLFFRFLMLSYSIYKKKHLACLKKLKSKQNVYGQSISSLLTSISLSIFLSSYVSDLPFIYLPIYLLMYEKYRYIYFHLSILIPTFYESIYLSIYQFKTIFICMCVYVSCTLSQLAKFTM